MFTRITVTALALTVLGAGALAFSPSDPYKHDPQAARTTVFEKNQAWPIKGNITMDPCAQVTCKEV